MIIRNVFHSATAQVSAALAKIAQSNPTENAVQLRARVLSKESVRPFTSGACLTDENCGLGYLFFNLSTPSNDSRNSPTAVCASTRVSLTVDCSFTANNANATTEAGEGWGG